MMGLEGVGVQVEVGAWVEVSVAVGSEVQVSVGVKLGRGVGVPVAVGDPVPVGPAGVLLYLDVQAVMTKVERRAPRNPNFSARFMAIPASKVLDHPTF